MYVLMALDWEMLYIMYCTYSHTIVTNFVENCVNIESALSEKYNYDKPNEQPEWPCEWLVALKKYAE